MILDPLKGLMHLLYSIPELIAFGGYFILFAIIFVETGIMLGFFLPGDSLLITAGLFAARGDLNIYILIPLLSFAAIAGDSVNYWIGKKAGHALFHRKESRFFKKKYFISAQKFYDKHGGKTIVLARFVPIIRTFAPVVAGIANMAIDPAYRNNGIGTKLMKVVDMYISNNDFNLSILYPSVYSQEIKFYSKFGYIPYGDTMIKSYAKSNISKKDLDKYIQQIGKF